jgi:hypothetical protein
VSARRGWRFLAALFWAVIALALPVRPALAQSSPELHFHSDADVVGIGETFHVTLEALSSSDTPVNPQLGATPGFAVLGISPSTSTQVNIVNGTMSTQHGLTTVWTLRATKLGSFNVGPALVTVGNTRFRGDSLLVRVVPAGQAPRRAPPAQQNPFDPFSALFGQFGRNPFPGFEPQQQRPQPEEQVDPHLALDQARAPAAFLHAVVDKNAVVVGEQVTYTVYIYIDSAITRTPELNDPHEAPATDFVKRSLQADDAKVEPVGSANVGGRLYYVQLLRKSALFPLHAGDLEIGQMSVQLNGAGAGLRKSEDLFVHVSEPPVAGRPAGYMLGDVGTMALEAEVSGRDVEQEGAIGVTVSLAGTGNLPEKLHPPERAGVEWLDPEVTAHFASDKGRFAGTRTFQYVVRFHKAGDIDLGDFTLPYWNPLAGAYEVARAPVGVIHVKPGAVPVTSAADTATDPLPGLPRVRATREPLPPPRRHFDDASAFWFGLAAMPFAYAVAVGASGATRRIRERRVREQGSPRTELRTRVAAANAAAAGGDARALDAATARALEGATIAGCGVNVRGLTNGLVAQALTGAGVAEESARQVESLLQACEMARFSASEGGATEAKERWEQAQAVITRLAGRT